MWDGLFLQDSQRISAAMKILAFSDLHRDRARADAILAASVDADVVVGAGDFATFGQGLESTLGVLARLTVPFVLVPGNHEKLDALEPFAALHAHWHLLHGSSATINGVVFYGVGYAIEPDAKGNIRTVLSDEAAKLLFARCPTDAVLVTHAPAYGATDMDHDGTLRGSHTVRRVITARRPKLHLCGHIHAAWGTSTKIGRTLTHNLGPTVNWFDV
jgi:uncharacterized protein